MEASGSEIRFGMGGRGRDGVARSGSGWTHRADILGRSARSGANAGSQWKPCPPSDWGPAARIPVPPLPFEHPYHTPRVPAQACTALQPPRHSFASPYRNQCSPPPTALTSSVRITAPLRSTVHSTIPPQARVTARLYRASLGYSPELTFLPDLLETYSFLVLTLLLR
ncbi:hypothetical protein DAEQUDRAFT_749183 [Daedalea quercina L-15889]|uniref:Uncharacterized protein n=1 Tax=Daedalea quercina L-15889 TaxID=1314783 RepID=A0A165T317_9APHY|nr:hypothetical protein DAEQUDRAFT_749183 [Daedalea quercina L-15889]